MTAHRLISFAAVLLLLTACQTSNLLPMADDTLDNAAGASPGTLRLYNWDTYMDPAILDNFAAEFGATIQYDIFDSTEEMLENVRQNPDAYDLIVPTDYAISVLRSERLLGVLNRENIPNFINLDPQFLNPAYDPGNRHCIPYQWGTLGIDYNIAAIGRTISSWEEFFSPEFYGRIALMDSMRTTMGMALLYLGHSPNSSNLVEIAAARDFLISLNEHVVAYAPDSGQDMLLDGRADLVIEWSGDILQIMDEEANIRYLIPEEGAIIWTDNICLMAEAANSNLAEAFLNYLLEPEVGAALSNYIRYGSPNRAALQLINTDDLANPAIYPSSAIRQRLYFLSDLDAETNRQYEAAWTAVITDFEAKQ